MRRVLIVAAAVCVLAGCGPASTYQQLLELPDAETRFLGDFTYELRLEQPLDHSNSDAGSFLQRIIINDRGYRSDRRPVVLVTEGYTLGDNQVAELAEMLGANEVRMEHRFVGDSVPEGSPWQYLTIEQAAADAHRVRELLGEIYPGPWVATGWSKGGQTAVIYRWLYPDDVVATVAYDAPLPRALEDPRIDAHFHTVGAKECRDRLTAFQLALLEHKAELLPHFRWFAKGKGMGLSVGVDAVFDYSVLEYPFSFWQYSEMDCDEVPEPDAEPEVLLDSLVTVVGVDWFSDATLDSASFHQFCTELGFYGYDEAPFAGLLAQDDYPMCIYAPNWTAESYDPASMEAVDRWLRTEATGIMSLYGGLDPWSAPAMPVGEGLDQLQLWDEQGKHFTYIRTLDDEQQLAAREALARWLGVPLSEVAE